MKAYVYILYFGKPDRYYTGSTNDVERRISQHRGGHTYSTKKLGEFKLVFSQEFENLSAARYVESKIKSWKRRDFIEKIVKDGYIKIT
jgi:putative endonuclease